MKRLVIVLLSSLLFVAATCEPAPNPPPNPQFVQRNGSSLTLGGQNFRYLSYNAFSLLGCGLPDEIPTGAEIDAFFGGLRQNSLVRTFAFPNTNLGRLDDLVNRSGAHGVKLILSLTDNAGHCGDPDGPKSSSWYSGGYQTRYMPWLQTVVPRYRDNPAIGMWELINEPGGVSNSAIRSFFDAASAEIKRLDRNHLVESGAHAPWLYGGNSGWRFIHESPNVDVTSLHEYDMNPGASPHLPGAVSASDAIGKPLILGEVGIFANTNGDPNQFQNGHPCVSFAQRINIFRSKFDATFATSIDGVNVWNWFPHNKQACRLETYPDDPLIDLAGGASGARVR